MKKTLLIITIALFSTFASAQQRQMGFKEPVSFAKEKIERIAKYVEVSKDDSTKLQKIFIDYQTTAKTVLNDREKLGALMKDLQVKIESVMGSEKYKIYREKSKNDPANQRPMRH